jgi:hypothetical protein
MSEEIPKKKTWKRETAWGFIFILCYAIYAGDVEMVKVIVWPIMLFVGAAFGMDWTSKQTDLLRK